MKILAIIPGSSNDNLFIFAKRQVEQLRCRGFVVEICYINAGTNLIQILKALFAYRSAIDEFKPDIIHAHYGTITSFIAAIGTLRPLVITFRGSDINPVLGRNFLIVKLSHLLSQVSAVRASHIVCVSEKMKSSLWYNKDRVSVIPSGVDLAIFKQINMFEARHVLGLTEKKFLILFNLGAGGANKRLDIVNATLELLKKSYLVDLIVMRGDIRPDDVPLYLNAVNVLLLTSDYEGSPTIIQEAMACNTPICSVQVGDVDFMLEGVSNCHVIERNPKDIANSIISIINNGKRSDGRDFSDRFSAQHNLIKLMEIYNKIKGNAEFKD